MRRFVLVLMALSMALAFVGCGSASLSEDEQYALDCVKQVPGMTEESIAESLGDVYLVKELDGSIKYAVVNYTADYYGTSAYGEAVFKDGSYYIDANDTFDTTDLSSSNFDKIIAQRDVRMVDIGEQPTGAEWEIVHIDTEVLKQALLEQ